MKRGELRWSRVVGIILAKYYHCCDLSKAKLMLIRLVEFLHIIFWAILPGLHCALTQIWGNPVPNSQSLNSDAWGARVYNTIAMRITQQYVYVV